MNDPLGFLLFILMLKILNQVASDSGDVGGEIGGLRMGLCVPSSCSDDQITGALNEMQNR